MYIDQKYLLLASSQLQGFKKKGDYVYNFRCPYCGDSQKSKSKARGFFFPKEINLIYKCHNCGKGASLKNFLKHLDPSCVTTIYLRSTEKKISMYNKSMNNPSILDKEQSPSRNYRKYHHLN